MLHLQGLFTPWPSSVDVSPDWIFKVPNVAVFARPLSFVSTTQGALLDGVLSAGHLRRAGGLNLP